LQDSSLPCHLSRHPVIFLSDASSLSNLDVVRRRHRHRRRKILWAQAYASMPASYIPNYIYYNS